MTVVHRSEPLLRNFATKPPERLRTLSISVRTTVEVQSFVQDFFDVFVGIGLLLVVDGPVGPHSVHQRFRDPSTAKGVSQEAAKLGNRC